MVIVMKASPNGSVSCVQLWWNLYLGARLRCKNFLVVLLSKQGPMEAVQFQIL